VTTIPTDRIKCPVRKGVTHAPTFLSGHCETGYHDSCKGTVTNGCGCVIPCRCAVTGHPIDRPHPYEETPVLPSPFTVPDPKATEHPEAVVTPLPGPAVVQNATTNEIPGERPLAETVEDWTHAIATPRPWVDGTGEPGELEVMVRCFAMAAGDLLRSDDGPTDYDETAVLALLGILRASVRQALKLDALLVDHLHDHGTWGERIVEGIGPVRTYRRPKNTRWDERGTAYAVLAKHMEETGGEVPDPGVVIDWLLEAAAVDYYRVTALRALGIDVDEFRHQEKGTRAVDVPVPD
jgi:hypothetical protein